MKYNTTGVARARLSIIYTLSNYALMFFSLISSILIRRWLDPYMYGIVATLNIFIAYATFANLGALNAAEIRIPFFRGAGKLDEIKRLEGVAFTFTSISTLVFCSGVAFWAIWEAGSLGPELSQAVILTEISFFGLQIVNFYITILRANHDFIFLSKHFLWIGLIKSVSALVITSILGFWGYIMTINIITILQLGVLISYQGYLPRLQMRLQEAFDLMRIGFPMFLLGLSAVALKTIDSLVVLQLFDIEHMGHYSIAVIASTLMFTTTNSITAVLFPQMNEEYGKIGDEVGLIRFIKTPMLVLSTLLPMACSLMYLASPYVVGIFLPQFSPGLPALRVVSLSSFFLAMIGMNNGYLMSSGKSRQGVVVYGLSVALVAAVSSLILSYGVGLIGVAVATSVGYLFCFILMTWRATKSGFSGKGTLLFIGQCMLPILYASVLVITLEQIFVWALFGYSWMIILPLEIISFLLLYTPIFILYEGDINLLKSLIPSSISAIRKLLRG